MPINGSGSSSGGGVSRAIPKKGTHSFIYWDMTTTAAGGVLPIGGIVTATGGIKNQGYGGAAGSLDLTLGFNGGDGVVIACSGPTGGGIDVGGTAAGKGGLRTAGTDAPLATDDLVMSVACRFRAGFGVGSPILWTKSYIVPGGGWVAPFNAFGPSLKNTLDGQCDYNVNVGGANNGVELSDRFALPVNTDLWIDLVKRADGTASIFINATVVATFNPGLLSDFGAGEWMLGGNTHTNNDSVNAQIYFAEVVTSRLTDAQIITRAKSWLGWSL